MPSSDSSFLGLAKQTAFGSPNTTDADFKYMLVNRGADGPNPIVTGLDPEVGGGAMPRDVLKLGVNSGGQYEFIPRPETLGFLFHGLTGVVATATNYNDTGVMATTALTGGTQNITTGLTNPAFQAPATAPVLMAVGTGGAAITVTITGVNVEDAGPGSDTIVLTGTPDPERKFSTKHFSTITQVSLPAGSGSVSVGYADGSYTHTYTLGANQYSAPYYTFRSAPASLWGEQYNDCRVSFTALTFRSPDYLRGTFAFMGRTPSKVSTGTWGALAKVDGGAQFITPASAIEIPTSTSAKVLSGSIALISNIPLDQQYIVGGYEPVGLDIVSRQFNVQFGLKIDDEVLYTKMMYDPAGGNAWVPDIFREADNLIRFRSDKDAAIYTPAGATVNSRSFELTVSGNGLSGDNSNVAWSATPPARVAQRQLVMNVVGTFLADPTAGEPITLTLVNRRASY